jgi:hypothetical protein
MELIHGKCFVASLRNIAITLKSPFLGLAGVNE